MTDKTQIGYLFDETWKTYKEKFCLFATILLLFQFIPYTIYNIINILNPVEVTPDNFWNQLLIHGPISLALFMISFIGTVAILYVLLKNRQTNTITDALNGGMNYYLPALGVTLLITLMLIPLFILLIIPGLIFSIYWMFSQYIVIDKDEKVTKSIGQSMDIVKGNWWEIFGRFALIILVMIAILFSVTIVLGLLLFIVSGPTLLTTSVSPGLEIASTIINNAIYVLISIFITIYSTQLYIGYRDKYKKEKTKTQKTKTTKKK
jgi:hypothetical protein